MTAIRRYSKVGACSAVGVALLLVVPLAGLEWWNGPGDFWRLPWELFGLLAAMAAVATWLSLPATGRIDRGHIDVHLSTLARLALVAVLVVCWVSLVSDQMPCFLGVPNCD